ncbi:heavy-metal-associated domain-containing protein [Streptomyces boninensis]|uniref:heavy-metal-associated domain-containing protein n=1 Tax=Streptomyces boninensis TaxID=2039455 RepID=UPI003B226843
MSESQSCCTPDGSCGGGGTATTVAAPATQTTTVFTVSGMTCGHCEASVAEEISALPGVTAVKADAASGKVSVDAAESLDEEAVRAAVDEAGYELVGRA